MGTRSITQEISEQQNTIIDDISEQEPAEIMDETKLLALKAKSKAKQQENRMSAKIVAKKERSIVFGVVGTGQGGTRLAESFYKLGYDVVAINTAMQDLKHIEIPDDNKLLLESAFAGAAKELQIGHAAAESNRDAIIQLVNEKLPASQINILCTSLGGGSGAGSVEVLVNILVETGKPLIVMAILPMANEDVQTKHNAIETLSKLTKYAKEKKIANLILIDNAKIESIYQSVGQMDFYKVANKAIVDPIDAFNTFSMLPSNSKALDSTELLKIMVDGEGLTVYGEFTVENYQEDTAIAEAVINNLSKNLLAEGLDLKQAKYVGFMVAANKDVWAQIPASSINYASSMINDLCGQPAGIFKGIYSIDSSDNIVKVYSIFSGLGLPTTRLHQLRSEANEYMAQVHNKNEQRAANLELDTGTNETISEAQKIKQKIQQKSSAFGKMLSGGVKDRRK